MIRHRKASAWGNVRRFAQCVNVVGQHQLGLYARPYFGQTFHHVDASTVTILVQARCVA
jgi:hypothetical protein